MTFHKIALEFNSLIAHRQFMETLDYYDEDVMVADNLDNPVVGKAAWRTRVQDFADNASINTIEVVSMSSEENLSFTNWYYSFEHPRLGKFSGHRFSVQRWRDGKIIQENHFYQEK